VSASLFCQGGSALSRCEPAGLLAIFFLTVLGFLIGNGFDVRDRLNDV
jgi:hypothetical protein